MARSKTSKKRKQEQVETRRERRKKIKSGFDAPTRENIEVVSQYRGGLSKLTTVQKEFFEPIRTKEPQGFSFKGSKLNYDDLLDTWVAAHPRAYKFKKVNLTDRTVMENIVAFRDGEDVPDTSLRSRAKVNKIIARIEKNRRQALKSYAMADLMYGFKQHKDFPTRMW